MRDVALLMMLLALAGVVWRTPWLGVLALAFIGYMHPQGYAEGVLQEAPLFAVFFVLTVLAVVLKQRNPWGVWLRDRFELIKDWRLVLMIAIWVWSGVTSAVALVPDAAWQHWIEYSKVFATVGLTLMLVDDRRKLDALLLMIALAIALVALKGGYWALIHGAQDRVYGSNAGHFADNNHFAVANLMALPLLLYFITMARSRALRWLIGVFVFFSLVAVVSSWSRGGLLALGAAGLALAITSRQKVGYLVLIAGLAVSAVILMPEAWMQRMETIADPEAEGSARSRLEFWQNGLNMGMARPLWGWGFGSDYALNDLREWHSSYVQVFAEQGVVGSLLWLILLGGSIVRLFRTNRVQAPTMCDPRGSVARALMASLVAYGVGGAFLGIAYWDIFYHLIVVAILAERLPARVADPPIRRQDSLHAAGAAEAAADQIH